MFWVAHVPGRQEGEPSSLSGLFFFFFSCESQHVYVMWLLVVVVKSIACLSVVGAILVGRIFRRAFGFGE